MRGQLRTQQIGVAPRNEKAESLSLQAIDKQLPPGEVLDFVQKKIPGIAVDTVDGADDPIVVAKRDKPLIIEIDIAEGTGP